MDRSRPEIRYSLVLLVGTVCLGACLGGRSVSIGWGQEGVQGALFSRTYRPEEYGGASGILRVVQNDSGIIYAAKQGGVLEFDGETWRRIPHPQDRAITSLAVGPDGMVYVGCHGDFGMLTPDEVGAMRFQSLAAGLNVDVGVVRSVVAARTSVYFATFRRLFRYLPSKAADAERLKVFEGEDPFNCVSLVDGQVVVARGGYDAERLLIAEDDKLEPVPGTMSIQGVINGVVSFGEGRWLIGTAGYGLFLYDGTTSRVFESEAHDSTRDTTVWAMEAVNDRQWVITTNGEGAILIDRQGAVLRVLDHTAGLQRTIVTDAMLDQEEGLWLCTPHGMTRVEVNAPLEYFGGNAGLHSNVRSLCRFRDRLYVATQTGCMTLEPAAERGQSARFEPVAGIKGTCHAVAVVGDQLFVGGNQGLWVLDSDGRVAQPMFQGYINSLVPAPDGRTVYASTYHHGVKRVVLTDGQWKDAGNLPGTSHWIGEMLMDDEGQLWLAAQRGTTYQLERVENPDSPKSIRVTTYGKNEGLSSTRLTHPFLIDGQVHVCGLDRIYGWDSPRERFQEVRADDLGLLAEQVAGESVMPRILAAATDVEGGVWLSTQQHVIRLVPGEQGPLVQHPLRKAGRRRIRALFADSDGAMWAWAGDGTLIRHRGVYDAAQESNAAVPPLIRHVGSPEGRTLLSGRLCADHPSLELPYDLASLQIEFASPRYSDRDAARYQWRLIGMDDAWSNWTDRAAQLYPALREGDYRFEVRTRDGQMRISPVTALSIRVLPPWYRTWAAYLAYAAALIVAVYGIITWRVRVMRSTVSRLQREIAAREEAQAANEVLQAQLAQSQRLDAVGTLAAGVAHDFNNALAAIVTYAELAASSLPTHRREAEFIEGILRASRQASGTTKGLLTFSRSTGSEKRPADLGALVSDSIDFLRRLLPASIQTRVVVPADRVLYCRVDDTQIQQVLMNLVVNARDAMPDGGELSITVAPYRGARPQAMVTIQDTGRGMSEDVRRKVFEPFFTTKSREQGTGLGMSIVHGIISEHGGSIEIESAPGRGATVRILLPTCSPSGNVSPTFDEPIDGAGKTVLLAEDNDNVRSGITKQLEALGFQVVEAVNGKEAVAVVLQPQRGVDLAILDVDLPRKSGIECLREIRQRMPDFPAILISGVPSIDLESLPATFLRKPFTKSTLAAAIQRQLCRDTEPVGGESSSTGH